MTHDDFTRRLESYLDDYEGVTPLPESVRDAVRAALPSVKQGGPLGGPQRFWNMTLQLPATARYGIAAAAVVAAIAVGAIIFAPGQSNVGGPGSSETPAPSSAPPSSEAPSAEPTATGPTDLVGTPLGGDLAPGDYYLDVAQFPARLEFTVPEGWWYFWGEDARSDSDVHALLVNSTDTGAADGSAWGLSFATVEEVRVDPCDSSAGFQPASVAASVDALAEAFSSWPELPATVEDVTLGGYAGKRVELTLSEVGDCQPVLFHAPSTYNFDVQLPTSEPFVNQFTILDIEGSVLVVWTTDFPATTQFEVDGGAEPDPEAHVADQEQLRAILDSLVIVPR